MIGEFSFRTSIQRRCSTLNLELVGRGGTRTIVRRFKASETLSMERQPRRRRRPALSCIECRQRKIKCDRSEPCTNCVRIRVKCAYKIFGDEPIAQQHLQRASSWGPTPSQSVNARSPSAPTEAFVVDRSVTEHADELLDARVLERAKRLQTANTRRRNDTLPANGAPEGGPLQALLERVQLLEESLKCNPVHGLSETGRDIFTRHSRLRDPQITLNKTRILRWSHWMGTAKEVWPIISSSYDYILISSSSYPSLPVTAKFVATAVVPNPKNLKYRP